MNSFFEYLSKIKKKLLNLFSFHLFLYGMTPWMSYLIRKLTPNFLISVSTRTISSDSIPSPSEKVSASSSPIPESISSASPISISPSVNDPIGMKELIIEGKKIHTFDDIQVIVKIRFFRFLYDFYLLFYKTIKGPRIESFLIKFGQDGIVLAYINGCPVWEEHKLKINLNECEKLFHYGMEIMKFYSGTFDGQKLTINGCSKSYTFDQLNKEYTLKIYPLMLLAQEDLNSLLSSDYFPPDMIKLVLSRFELPPLSQNDDVKEIN